MQAKTTYSLPGPDTITRVELDNGPVVLVYENKTAESVVLNCSLLAGSIYETPEQGGLAALTAAALMRGTASRDFDAIHSALEDIGAELSVDAAVHSTLLSGKALAEDLPVLVEILSDVLRHPAFPPEHVDRARDEAITGLKYAQQDTRYRAMRAFEQALYPSTHPYHHQPAGSPETLQNLTPDDLRAFHEKHYGPRGIVIAIVGAVDAAAAVDVVRRWLEDWHNPDQPEEPPLPPLSPPQTMQRVQVALPDKSQADIVLGAVGPSRFAEDYLAAALANSVLGEFGMMGRLGHEIREKLGLAYYATSRLRGGRGPGPWLVSAGVAPQNVELAVERAAAELRRLTSEPVSAEDLADNQSYFTGRLPLGLEHNAGIASAVMGMEIYRLGLDHLLRYNDLIYSLTPDDLLAAARRYLNPDALVIAVAGPPAE